MDKTPIQQIADFLIEVREAICEGDAALRLHLTELYRIIQRLTDATFSAQDQELKVLPANLE